MTRNQTFPIIRALASRNGKRVRFFAFRFPAFELPPAAWRARLKRLRKHGGKVHETHAAEQASRAS